MMDHYEELGIERDASAAEIRQAYRRLMQLLHPDHCSDAAGRRLAELQARRLNGILAALSSPVERERYDRMLAFPAASLAPPPPMPSSAPAPHWLWPVAAAAVALAVLSLLARPSRGLPPTPALQATAVPVVAAVKKPAGVPVPSHVSDRKRLFTKPAQTVENVVARESEPPPPETPHFTREEPSDVASLANEWQPPPGPTGISPGPEAPPGGTPPRQPLRPTLAGEWLFLPQTGVGNNRLYPPEYIELRVTEGAGLVRGKYRARYHIPDQAISPMVTFEFQGRGGEDSARLPWAGPGGSRGEVTLRLITGGALEVTWVASRMGTELGLISGTATLVRRIEHGD